MSTKLILLIAFIAAVAFTRVAEAAPGASQEPKPTTAVRLNPQSLQLQASRDRQAVTDLDKIISAQVSSKMSIKEQSAVTELAQKALGLRNAVEYRRQIRERMREIREALAENPKDAALLAELRGLEAKLDTASDMTQMMQLQLQDAMQNQQRTYTLLSNIMKSQHETAKAVIDNLKP